MARRWAGRCYGQSDIGWSRAGQRAARALTDRLAARAPAAIVHSDLRRTRLLAERLARRLGLEAMPDPRWRERCFGTWEGRSWDAIWREVGGEMDRMVSDPAGYRPGGGETTAALGHRALAAWRSLPAGGTVVVVTHGGPIATLRAALAGLPANRLASLVPGTGEVVELTASCRPRDAGLTLW